MYYLKRASTDTLLNIMNVLNSVWKNKNTYPVSLKLPFLHEYHLLNSLTALIINCLHHKNPYQYLNSLLFITHTTCQNTQKRILITSKLLS